MEELRDTRKDLEEAIRLEEATGRLPTPEDVGAYFYAIRAGDWTDRKFLKELIRIFVRAVYVFDDKITIHYNYGTDADLDYKGLAEEDSCSEGEVFSMSPERGTKAYGHPERDGRFAFRKAGLECTGGFRLGEGKHCKS